MTKKKLPAQAKGTKEAKDECLVPPALPKGELHKLLFKQSENEAKAIKDYVEWQAHGEDVG
jgi:hypothetical protein